MSTVSSFIWCYFIRARTQAVAHSERAHRYVLQKGCRASGQHSYYLHLALGCCCRTFLYRFVLTEHMTECAMKNDYSTHSGSTVSLNIATGVPWKCKRGALGACFCVRINMFLHSRQCVSQHFPVCVRQRSHVFAVYVG